MKEKIRIFCILILMIVCSCSSDNSNENDQNLNKGLLKSVVYGKDNYANYEYENGLLTKFTSHLSGNIVQEYNYEYNTTGKLSASKLTGGQKSSYIYDNQNRLIKETVDGTQDYSLLEYFSNKIIVTRHFETLYGIPKNLVSELYIDDIGRIIRTLQITPTYYSQYLVNEFKYDGNNNVVEISYRENTDNKNDVVLKFEYDSKKNPQYYANRLFYSSLYYLILSNSSSVAESLPNNIISVTSLTSLSIRKMTYNSDNFPITNSYTNYLDNLVTPSETGEVVYEYY